MQIHLVDGTYELFRNYFGPPSAKGPDGREVGATRGLVRTLIALLKRPEVTHVGVAFDTVIESFRNRLFDGYKTGEGIEPDLAEQFPLAEEAACALGLSVWSMIDYEADDALASAAHALADHPDVERIVICSPDKDLAQCVRGARVVTWDRRREIVLDEAGVRERFGVEPAQIPDLLGLQGDSADGIPGLPGWGARSAAQVLAGHPTIEAIPDDAAAWKAKPRGAARLAQTLASRRADALLYKRLATLVTDLDLGLAGGPEPLRWRGAEPAALRALEARTGLGGLAAALPPVRSGQ